MKCKNKRYMPDPFITFQAVNYVVETGEMETGRVTIPPHPCENARIDGVHFYFYVSKETTKQSSYRVPLRNLHY